MRLFRAVRDAEREDLLAKGHLRNPVGYEVKYFTKTGEEAERYARMAEQAYQDGPYHLVQAEIDDVWVTDDMIVDVDAGLGAVILPDDLLQHVRQAVLIGRV